MNSMKKNLAEIYIEKVVSGEIVAGKTVKQAIARHIDDLAHAKERGWYFDEKAGNLAIKAIQLIPHTSGKWSGQGFQLQGWQAFVLWSVYGWKLIESKTRRFKKVYIKVPRKNGKTEFLAAIGCLDMLLFGVDGGQLWWAATKKDQAKIGWERQKNMMDKLRGMDKTINKRFVTNAKRIISKQKNMFADSIGRDSKSEDGHLVYRAYIDELHAHPTGDMVNILESGMGAFAEPLTWIITTAGFNTASYCKTFEDVCKSILNGDKENDGLFILIFDLDEGDDWEDETTWAKANPGLGISPSLGFMFQEYKNAKTEGAAKRISFLTKNLNLWTSTETTWIAPEIWRASGRESGIKLEDLKGQLCYGGLDLSANKDVTALALLFPLANNMFALYVKMWVPADTARKRTKEDGVKYTTWIDEGWLSTTPGEAVDYGFLRRDINELAEQFKIKAINYDRWNSNQLVNELTDDGAQMYPFGQGFGSMSGPTKEFERLILKKQIVHFDNPVLAWMLQNVSIVLNPAGDMKADKGKSSEKIDGIIASIMAIGAWLSLREIKKTSVYENRGVRFL